MRLQCGESDACDVWQRPTAGFWQLVPEHRRCEEVQQGNQKFWKELQQDQQGPAAPPQAGMFYSYKNENILEKFLLVLIFEIFW